MTIEEMMIEVISRYGHESEQAIVFCSYCEHHSEAESAYKFFREFAK